MLEAAALVLALLNGFLAVCAFDPAPNTRPRWAAALFRVALGSGIGVGLASIVFLFLEISGAASPATILAADLVLGAVLFWQCVRTRTWNTTPADSSVPAPSFRWNWALALALGIVLLIVGSRLVQMASSVPVGRWDAWAIWN